MFDINQELLRYLTSIESHRGKDNFPCNADCLPSTDRPKASLADRNGTLRPQEDTTTSPTTSNTASTGNNVLSQKDPRAAPGVIFSCLTGPN